MSARDIVLCQPVRTAIGAYNGTLKGVPATALGAVVVRETLRRAGLSPGEIGSVVMGNVIQAGNRMNPARQASIGGGVAHGHPIGATGAVLVTRLLHSMKRDGLRKGVVTLCIGGGQGIALALEAA